ncbi:MAG: dynamin family protein, partial [Firmicutes bacterium]|nr:dynamin family protein [Bacillota bacterium]
MTEFYTEFNPYKNETIFKINGEPATWSKFKLITLNKYRMQAWLEKLDNWNGFLDELCAAIDDNEIKLIFKGRKIDFEDLEYYVREYISENKTDKKITLEHIDAKNDTDILESIKNVVEKLAESPVEELNGDKFKDTYDKVKNSKFPISVIATMSSGKSTIINSLLGTDLLPSKNEACTATVARITDNNDISLFTAECRDKDGNIIIERKPATLADIESYNDNPNVMYIDIEGSIPEIDSSSMRLVLQDTPGPNNSRNEKHGAVTNTIIKSENNSVVMYIMNATQFAIDDDKHLLEDIAKEMKKHGKQSRDRFIFVLNKCDRLDPDKGETVEKLLAGVRKYLKEEFGIHDPNLFPVSALTAKIIRKYLKGEPLTRSEKRELDVDLFLEEEKCHFEKFATLSPSSRAEVDRKLEEAKAIEDAELSNYKQVLIHTGIPAIEAAINEYLKKYAYP